MYEDETHEIGIRADNLKRDGIALKLSAEEVEESIEDGCHHRIYDPLLRFWLVLAKLLPRQHWRVEKLIQVGGAWCSVCVIHFILYLCLYKLLF